MVVSLKGGRLCGKIPPSFHREYVVGFLSTLFSFQGHWQLLGGCEGHQKGHIFSLVWKQLHLDWVP